MTKICFVCTGNSCRSQMAEGIAKKLAGDKVEVYSAGSHPLGYILPNTLLAMREIGIDISNQHSKSLAEVPLDKMDWCITLCDSAAKFCPTVLAKGAKLHWPFKDPHNPSEAKSEEEVLKNYREVRDAIYKKLSEWLKAI